MEPADADFPDGGNRRRVAALTIGAVVAVAIIAIVVVMATRSDNTKHPSSTSSTPVNTGPVVMPSLVTLTRAEATSRLARSGIAADRVIVSTKPRTDVAPGTVLAQDPAPGLVATGKVTLTISSAPSTMPNLVGHNINSASAMLSTLNITFTTEDVLDATVADGTVVQQDPAANAPFARAIHLTVARTPIPTNLADLEAVGPAPTRSSTQTIAGRAFKFGLFWDTSVCPGAAPVQVTYNLDGRYRQFAAIAGLGSESDNATDQVRIHVSIDGTVVLAGVLDKQRTVPIALDVTKHSQLELTFTQVPNNSPTCSTAKSGLGRARLFAIVDDLTQPGQ